MSKTKAKQAKGCDCAEQLHKQLKEVYGAALEGGMAINFTTGVARMDYNRFHVKWAGKPVKGKRLPVVCFTYCPCCGTRLPE